MIRSMTGYGCGETAGKHGFFKVEVKSVNNKFFDMNSRLPNGLFVFEDRIREHVQRRIKRGRIHVSVLHEDGAKRTKKVIVNADLVSSLLKEARRLKKKERLGGELDVNQVMALPGVLTFSETGIAANSMWSHIKKALNGALDSLDDSRRKEGRYLAKDLRARLARIRRHTDLIRRRSEVNVKRYKKDFASRIKELSGGIDMDKGRLEQEVAIYAKNCDVTEELTRLRSHVKNFGNLLGSGGEKGKMFDFIGQELMREANTIGSKSGDFHISNHVIKIKGEIEKIREQGKNIE